MLNDITLGQYYPAESAIHRLDPRTKLVLMIAYIVFIFLIKQLYLFALAVAFVALVTALSKVPASYLLRSLKPMRLLVLLMFILNLFMIRTGDILVEWWRIRITMDGLMQAIFISVRLMLLICGTSLMTFTTTPIALTDGLERLLSPLAKLRFPAHELAMMMTIALRFIPSLIEEADKIMKAQMSRGADMESRNIIKRIKSYVPILVPLFVGAFRRADELAMAMESRCYHGGEGRTRMHVLKFSGGDAVAAGVMAFMFAAVITVQRIWPA